MWPNVIVIFTFALLTLTPPLHLDLAFEDLNAVVDGVVRSRRVVLVPKLAGGALPIDAVLCATVVQQHGKGFQCFARLEPIELSRLGTGAYSVTLELRRRPTAEEDPQSILDVSEWARLLGLAAPHTLRFRVEMGADEAAQPPAIYWVFPRNNERLSTGSFELSLRIEGGARLTGWIYCVSVDAPLPDRLAVSSESNNVVSSGCFRVAAPASSGLFDASGGSGASGGAPRLAPREVVLDGTFTPGEHFARVALYDPANEAGAAPFDAAVVAFHVDAPVDAAVDAATRARPAASASATAAIEIVVMSVRSRDRYDEALTMIKSLLLHRPRRRGDGGSGGGGGPGHRHLRVNINLITDAAGRAFFEAVSKTLAPRRPDVSFVFHDFDRVCAAPVDAFLREFGFPLTAHYSGRAGFCRLFFPDTLPAHLDAAIALESDQLFFRDVGELWDHFATWSPTQLVGIPELYKPWRDARGDGGGGGGGGSDGEEGRRRPRCAAAALGSNGTAECAADGSRLRPHNGVIGGVVMYNLSRLRALPLPPPQQEQEQEQELELELEQELAPAESAAEQQQHTAWGTWWRARLRGFVARGGGTWRPVLNDQDVLNAALALAAPAEGVDATVLFTVPCEWQLQYHAYLEEVRFCGEDGGGEGSEARATFAGFSCSAAAQRGAFLCRRAPALVHYMASSYRVASPSYYTEFWKATAALPLSML